MKKTIGVLLAVLMTFSLLPTTAWAAVTGRCGKDATFSLDDNGTVTISGTGSMVIGMNTLIGSPTSSALLYRME